MPADMPSLGKDLEFPKSSGLGGPSRCAHFHLSGELFWALLRNMRNTDIWLKDDGGLKIPNSVRPTAELILGFEAGITASHFIWPLSKIRTLYRFGWEGYHFLTSIMDLSFA